MPINDTMPPNPDPHARDADGVSPLDAALRMGARGTAALLARQG